MQAKSRAQLAHKRKSLERKRKTRIFVVEDHDIDRNGILKLIELNPARDLECVGDHSANPPGLAKLIADAGTDVVIVDLALGGRYAVPVDQLIEEPCTSGVEAIRSIREALPMVKILALSNYPHLRPLALKAGAHEFRFKGESSDELREVIRCLARGTSPTSVDIGKPGGLALHIENADHRFEVIGTRGRTPILRLEPIRFVLLCYLATERVRGTQPAILQERRLGYRPHDRFLWESLIKLVPDTRGEGMHHEFLTNIAVWRHGVNQAVESYLPSHTHLIVGPGGRGSIGSYILNLDIEANRIEFHGFPQDFPLKLT